MVYLIALSTPFIINVSLALWVHKDAGTFRAKGVSVTPGLWSTLVIFGSIPLFLIYLLLRIFWSKKAQQPGLQPLPPAPTWTNWLTIIIMFVVIGGTILLIKIQSITYTPPTSTDFLSTQLLNVSFDLILNEKGNPTTRAIFINGKYEYSSGACSPSLCSYIFRGIPKFVDIDNDGFLDVISIMANWNGGNKTVNSVVVFLNKGGLLSYAGEIPIGTTPEPNSIMADKNKITVNYNSVYNGAAGWSDPVNLAYALVNSKLLKVQ